MIEEQKSDHIEIVHFRRQRIIEGSRQAHAVLHGRRRKPRRESSFSTLTEIWGILTIDRAGRPNGARIELGAVAGAGPHIEHLHARPQPREGEEWHWIAAFRFRIASQLDR
jgi:hypothetical protein